MTYAYGNTPAATIAKQKQRILDLERALTAEKDRTAKQCDDLADVRRRLRASQTETWKLREQLKHGPLEEARAKVKALRHELVEASHSAAAKDGAILALQRRLTDALDNLRGVRQDMNRLHAQIASLKKHRPGVRFHEHSDPAAVEADARLRAAASEAYKRKTP